MRKGIVLALLAGSGSGCVYPASEPSGIELSWSFVESNEVDKNEVDKEDADDEDAVRVRSCTGAHVEQLAFEIDDVDDPRRHGVFRFDCITGFQTSIELQTAASDAFVPLQAGTYSVTVLAVDDATNAPDAERLDAREVDVAERGVRVEIWELRRAPVTWTMELRGGDACESVAMSLVYAAPEADLPELTPSNDDPLPLYRSALRSDRDLEVGGQPTPCGPALDGVHRFEGIDRGAYLLELDVDGRACAVQVDLRGSAGATSVIDLASLPCGG